jgi:anti-sigma regulatory factor (Ser/Thr protein kinase)/anti-anti-sigma regulatory factor
MHKELAESPPAILVDLAETRVADSLALTIFAAFAHTAAEWPGCPVMVCAPSAAVRADLHRMAIDRAVPIYADRSAALAAAATLPPARRHSRRLPTDPSACGVAREVVRVACGEWHVTHIAEEAELVVAELVSNAIRHGGGAVELRVVLGSYLLHLSVCDGSPDPPRRVLAGLDRFDGGRGMILVDAIAEAWGSVPTDRGKTVWATVRHRTFSQRRNPDATAGRGLDP